MNYAASRLSVVQPSASAAISQTARQMKAAGEAVIDLGLGEPDFNTSPHIIEAAYAAAKAGETRYPPNDGTVALKSAIIAKFARDNALAFEAPEIFVSNGAKQIIYGALATTLEPDQEVIICAPFFDSYENIILALGGKPVIVQGRPDNAFRMTPKQLEAAITPNTRWLFLNYPSNPAGAVYSASELEALGEVLGRHPHVLVLADEIYEHIIFGEHEHVSLAAVCPSLKAQVLTVNGVSKAYAMTGWRIGYAGGPQPLIAAMTKMQSLISSGACSIAQAAAAEALNGPQDEVERFRQAFERRRDLVVAAANSIPGLSLPAPSGAFYALIGCEGIIGAEKADGSVIETDTQLAQYLLEDAQIACVLGSAYGLTPFIRLSMANSEENLAEAMRRIGISIASLKLPA